MTGLSIPFYNFTRGELTPLLAGRADFEGTFNGVRQMENMIVLEQGPARKRRGTRFVAEVKDHNYAPNLVPFIAATDQAYVIEAGNQYMRFFYDRARVLSSGSIYEISAPYASNHVEEIDDAQNNDVMYLTHELYAPQKLTRYSHTGWGIEPVPFRYGPLAAENINNAITLRASNSYGEVTITASQPVFYVGHVGSIWGISDGDSGINVYPLWKQSTSYGAFAIVRYDGRTYSNISGAATSGTTPPEHGYGTASDGTITWQFLNEGTGYFKVKAYISPTQVLADVQEGIQLPNSVVSSSFWYKPTPYWNPPAFSDATGWPRVCTFYESRFWLGREQRLYSSRSNEQYEDFREGSEDDAAMILPLISTTADHIRWLESFTSLAAGTMNGGFFIRSDEGAITPSTLAGSIKKNMSVRAAKVPPVLVSNFLMFLSRSRRKLYAANYNYEQDNYEPEDMTVMSEHITGGGLDELTYQAEPYGIVWGRRRDGTMTGLTINVPQKVYGWHRHILGGNQAKVNSFCTIPGQEGYGDETWLVVERTIGGATKRFIEVLEPEGDGIDFYVDAGTTYRGAATSLMTGLSHLEGETIVAWADGKVHRDLLVTSGTITLPEPASLIHAGLPYTAKLRTMAPQVVANINTVGKLRRLATAVIKLYRSMGGRVGRDGDHAHDVHFRKPDSNMDAAQPLFGDPYPDDVRQAINGTNDRDGSIYIENSDPLPLVVCNITCEVIVGEK